MVSRRQLLRSGLVAGGGLLLPRRALKAAMGLDRGSDLPPSPPVTPFQRDLPLPAVLQPVGALPGGVQCQLPAGLPPPLLYEVSVQTAQQEIIPGTQTTIWGYNGLYPGPTIRASRNQPIVVRFINNLDQGGVHTELSTHLHGGFTPAESDGFPNLFIHPGGFRDYCYPNIAPDNDDHDWQSTMWYHDHAMDLTGENVYMGLAGFYLAFDDAERDFIDAGVLPGDDFDIPLVLQDRRFDAGGQLVYDPLDHDGVLGDRFLVNGAIQPKLHVQRRKYRFRILNGTNARVYELRLSTGQPFLKIGNDSWLLAAAQSRSTVFLSMANRCDVIVDFRNAPSELYLENILEQKDGRGPTGNRLNPPLRLLKFIVGNDPPVNNATVAPGTVIRPITPILDSEITRTRRFVFERRNGAWVVNGRFFDPDRDDAVIRIGSAERWILENKSGGWHHPIHMHLESHHPRRLNGVPIAPENSTQSDTTHLGKNGVAEVYMRFRGYLGRYVFHCHNIEHEDMRMMGVYNIVS
jgi:FtsP/CotA-like multicopper oxidase with cupredoxin domain